VTRTEFGLAFADGSSWVIRALDNEAEATVRNLGMVLRLGPARDRSRLCSVSGMKPVRPHTVAGKRGLTCRLGPALNRYAEAFRMDRVTSAIAERSISSGGLLLHGALAVCDGAGFLLAGPSGVGKSTASRRLPAPWKALSDDCTFVVRDSQGRYWAHPWPTWSLLREKGLVAASWPLEQAVPLKALLFLRQSENDAIEPVTATPAAALTMESAHLLGRVVTMMPDTSISRATCLKYLRASCALAAAVPAFRLSVSPNGRFWEEIERAVPTMPRMDAGSHGCGRRTQKRKERLELTGKGPGRSRLPRLPQNREKAEAEHNKPEAAQPTTPARAVRPERRRRRRRNVPAPPRHLLSGSPKPTLLRFQAGLRTFLKLVAGRRVIASANDIVTEWHVQPSSRSPARRRKAPAKPLVRSRKSHAVSRRPR